MPKAAHELTHAQLLTMRMNDLVDGTKYITSLLDREVVEKAIEAYKLAIKLLEEHGKANQTTE